MSHAGGSCARKRDGLVSVPWRASSFGSLSRWVADPARLETGWQSPGQGFGASKAAAQVLLER